MVFVTRWVAHSDEVLYTFGRKSLDLIQTLAFLFISFWFFIRLYGNLYRATDDCLGKKFYYQRLLLNASFDSFSFTSTKLIIFQGDIS